jgi:hypothetical protein
MARPPGVNGRGDGSLESMSDGVDGWLAEWSCNRVGMERLVEAWSSASGTRKVLSTSLGREITAFDGLRSTVTMVARSALPASDSVSESLRYIAI